MSFGKLSLLEQEEHRKLNRMIQKSDIEFGALRSQWQNNLMREERGNTKQR